MIEVGETAGQAMELIMSKTENTGKEFTDDCMAVLTLCLSELIKSSFCPSHYQNAIEQVVKQLNEDLNE